MTPVRLAVAVADAMPHAPPPAEAEALDTAGEAAHADAALSPPPAASPPPVAAAVASRRRGGVRGWLSARLRRPAEYARAYLTASLEHGLELQARRTAEVAGAVARTEHWTRHADAAVAEARARADEAAATAAALGHALARLESRQAKLEAALAAQAATGDVREAAREAVSVDQLALAHRNAAAADHAVSRLDEVLGVLGPRFDELEIKARPLVQVDAESTAVRTGDGYVMLPRSEPVFVLAVANATSGGLEPGVRRVLQSLLRPGDACADVGANVGLLTVAMAGAVGPAGRVWAFEPEARVRAQLARTLHLNGLAQVALSGAAVGAGPGRLVFNQSPVIGHSSLYPLPEDEQAQARPVEVDVVRLDDVVPPGTALAAVKIDVEGAELDVLAGMRRVIGDSPDLAVVAEFGPSHLRRVGVTPGAWFAAFAAHGLEPRLVAEPDGRVSRTDAGALAAVESANLVFVRPGGAADARLPR